MTAPTEAEIREAYRRSLVDDRYDPLSRRVGQIEEAVLEFTAAFDWSAADVTIGESQLGDAVWADLRPTEEERLRELLYEARLRAIATFIDALREEIVASALEFAAEHPDAHRGPLREPVPA